MKGSIQLSADVALGLDAVTQTFAILGKRGSGKTNTASVLAEQLVERRLPIVYVDPIGVVWGLRYSRDGKRPGLPVIILGGEHADVPLEETGGAVIADFVIEHRQPVVLDLGLFSKGAQRRFMVDFAERLYLKNRDALHVMLDECDTFVPQRIEHGGERLVGAINDLVRKGRARGLGVTLISQRPALVNKDVLTQVETLIAHRMTGPQDRDAIERWIEHNADGGGDAVLASLQTLTDGEAWVWSPSWLKLLKRTHINLRETFDSSATPKAGARAVAPKHAAEVDLAALRDRLAATIERAKAEDPRGLKRQIAALEKQLKGAAAQPSTDPRLTVHQEHLVEELRDAVTGVRAGGLQNLDARVRELVRIFGEAHQGIKEMADRVARTVGQLEATLGARTFNGVPQRRSTAVPAPTARKPVGTGSGESMPTGHRRILLALARHGSCSKAKLAILARYASSGGGFNNYLGALRGAAWITGTGDGPFAITDAGLKSLGSFDPLPDDSDALFQEWMALSELGRAHRAIMQALKENGSLDKDRLATVCGYEPTGGGYNNALSKLRTLGIIEGKDRIDLAEPLR